MAEETIDVITGETRKLKIALDFDGVLHSYQQGWTGPIPFDCPVAGAQDFCRYLLALGYEVSIFTTRVKPDLEHGDAGRFIDFVRKDPTTGQWVPEMNRGMTLAEAGVRDWLKHWGFPEALYKDGVITHKKVHAELFIDDRGLRFEGNFDPLLDYIRNVNPKLGTWTGSQ